MTIPYLAIGPSFDDAPISSGDPALESSVQQILSRLGDLTNLSDWIRVIARDDVGTAGMTTANSEINTGATGTYDNIYDSISAHANAVVYDFSGSAKTQIDNITNVVEDASGSIINKLPLSGRASSQSELDLVPKYGETQRHTQDDFNTLNKTADVIITKI